MNMAEHGRFMAISHVCISCGLDLARVRARLEPRYALPIVVCPDCGLTTVRRKPRAWRSFRRLMLSLATLAAQLGLVVTGLAGLLAVSEHMGDVFARWSFGGIPSNEIIFRLSVCAAFAVALGAWLTAGFSHARWTTTWLVFYGAGIALIAVSALIDRNSNGLGFHFVVATLVMTVAIAGVPLGVLAGFTWRHVQRATWRWHRRRLRARRSGL